MTVSTFIVMVGQGKKTQRVKIFFPVDVVFCKSCYSHIALCLEGSLHTMFSGSEPVTLHSSRCKVLRKNN